MQDLRILAAGALILELVLDVITVAACHHRQLRMYEGGFASVQLPEVSVTVPHTVYQPCGSMTHFMDQRVPETIWDVRKDCRLQVMASDPTYSSIIKHICKILCF